MTNLGRYNEGELVGEWLDLPATNDEINKCLRNIGIDDIQYEEYFLTDYESTIDSVTCYISEYSNIHELNELAYTLSELDDIDISIFEAALELGDYTHSIKDLINLVDTLDNFNLLSDIHNAYDLGYYWIVESGCYNLKELGNLANYLDYEQFGQDILLNENGTFTKHGYIYCS